VFDGVMAKVPRAGGVLTVIDTFPLAAFEAFTTGAEYNSKR
jgi:hypothetical protein